MATKKRDYLVTLEETRVYTVTLRVKAMTKAGARDIATDRAVDAFDRGDWAVEEEQFNRSEYSEINDVEEDD